jgi:hypothetical protein
MGELEGNDPQPIFEFPEEIENSPGNAWALVHLRGLAPMPKVPQIPTKILRVITPDT